MKKLKCWRKSSNDKLISWEKENLKYPKNEGVIVIKASDGWVVNKAGYRGNDKYFSDNLLVTDSKGKALKKAIKYMKEHDTC